MAWIEFLICSSLLTFFAYRLCVEGINLSEKTHMEEGLIGIVFLALATSFPEIVTGAAAVFSLGKIGLGYGDIVGSVIVNLMILLGLDYFSGKGRLLLRVTRINRVTGVFMMLVGVVITASSFLRAKGVPLPGLGSIGVESILLVAIYFICLKSTHSTLPAVPSAEKRITSGSLRNIWAKFVFFLLAVMFLGVWMARVGEKIVLTTGLSETFTGTLLLGVATSLPEIIVSFTAIKAASADMAVGNILGSNIFDLCIVSFLDLLTGRPILGMLTPGQILATVVMLAMSVITVAGLLAGKRDTDRRLNWDTGLIFAVGLAGFVLLYYIH